MTRRGAGRVATKPADDRIVDPVERLADHVAPTCAGAVDALQVAAVLESDGLTDRAARDDYGYSDVFALAEEVFSRMPARTPDEPALRRRAPRALRELSHGLLYVLPSTAFPAAFALLGLRGLVTGMVLATALGWVWSMGNTVLAYRLLGTGHPAVAARILRFGMLLGLAVGAVGGLVLTWLVGLPPGVVLLVVAQLGFQLSAGVLLFFGLELTLVWAMAPTVVFGLGYLAIARPGLATGAASVPAWMTSIPIWVAGSGIWSVCVAVIAAYVVAARPGAKPHGDLFPATPALNLPRPPMWREVWAVLPIVGYAGLCAAYLLYADTRYVNAGTDLALAVTPLVLGMGALEWQARQFSERAVGLTRRVRYPADFVRRVWRLFGGGIGTTIGIMAALAAALMAVLAYADLLTGRGAVVIGAHVLLGGAYFIGFILLNHGRLAVLLAVSGSVLVGYAVGVAELPYAHWAIFLASSSALVVLLLVTVCTSLTEARRYRW